MRDVNGRPLSRAELERMNRENRVEARKARAGKNREK